MTSFGTAVAAWAQSGAEASALAVVALALARAVAALALCAAAGHRPIRQGARKALGLSSPIRFRPSEPRVWAVELGTQLVHWSRLCASRLWPYRRPST